MKYNLDVLNDKEFEDLAKDLLDSEFKVNFEIFKAGRDGGIDLRHTKNKPNEIIVQVKHYINSSYSNLKSQLRKEKRNLDQLIDKPERYIVFTSLPLNPKQSDEISAILSPFIKATGDIYGRRDVESLISNNHEIERKYFKLWLTSTNVLERILNNAVSGNSEFQESRINSRSKFYVQTRHIEHAFEYLNKNKFLIISGEPGVGKTTLAYMLVYEMMGEGFKLIYSDRSIRDAEDLLSNRADDKQVIFIDDFLGSNLHDIYHPINPENTIIRFIEQIRATPNKFLIFTSRTTILSQANQHFESFSRDRIGKMSNYELKIHAYTNLEKAKILYNHLFHFDVSEKFRDFFFMNANYLKIIKHSNYYPRLIETLTNEFKFKGSGFTSVEEYVFKNLDNPSKIWQAAFENQLTREDQIFLETLFTFGDQGVDILVLEQSFEYRVSKEVAWGKVSLDMNAFNHCSKKLQDGFLHFKRDTKTNELHISFINPSLADFFMEYLQINHAERFRIWSSILYVDQFEKTFGGWKSNFLTFRNHESEKYLSAFIENLDIYNAVNQDESTHFKVLDFFLRVFYNKIQDFQELVLKLMKSLLSKGRRIETWKLGIILTDIAVDEIEIIRKYVVENWDDIIDIMIKNVESADDLQSIVSLHEEYGKDFNDYLEDEDRKYAFEATVGSEFQSILNDHDFDSEIDLEAVDYYGYNYIRQKIDEKAFELYDAFLQDWKLAQYVSDEDVPYDLDTQRILDDYLFNLRYDHEDRLTSHSNKTNNASSVDENAEISRLFSR